MKQKPPKKVVPRMEPPPKMVLPVKKMPRREVPKTVLPLEEPQKVISSHQNSLPHHQLLELPQEETLDQLHQDSEIIDHMN